VRLGGERASGPRLGCVDPQRALIRELLFTITSQSQSRNTLFFHSQSSPKLRNVFLRASPHLMRFFTLKRAGNMAGSFCAISFHGIPGLKTLENEFVDGRSV